MIINFKNKGLEQFFLKGKSAKINPKHMTKLRLIIAKLNTSIDIQDMDFPGSNLHPLKGDKKDYWSVKINGNWRVIFRFNNENAYDVDYVDYH